MTAQQDVNTPVVDEAKVEEFVGKAIGDFSGAMTTLLCAIGDRLDLFKKLAEGPATSEALAAGAGIDPRYALEWLRAMASAGYIAHDRESGQYSLPPEHVPVLAEEAGPMFMCGGFSMLPGAMGVFDQLVERFRAGGGVSQDQYGASWWEGMQRFSEGWVKNMLVPVWIPAMPDLQAKLEAGARCADVGCGAGRASIKLAQEFPNTTHVGYDMSNAQLDRARANAEAAGLGDRVRFEKLDVSEGLPEKFDVITTFDVVHDSVDPQGLVSAVHDGLSEQGIYLCLDINCADDHADNEGPLATMFYGFSVTYCMTTSLANGGAGLGTCGLPESKFRELCDEAGFASMRKVPIENPFNNVYEARA
jgi:2-polyprenyl-3-methyl-5-hydroxy-6-metoxy-1,4-benzoquinol methylase